MSVEVLSMSNMADPKDLVKSRWAKWKLNFSGLTVRQKASKILSHIIVLFSIAMLVCVGLIILEYFSYDTTYGTMIKCEEVFNKKGDLKGYINEYIVAYEDEQMTLSSSQVVKKLYDNNEEVRLYIKEVQGGYKICETYKTN